jgi:phospholipase A1/A2
VAACRAAAERLTLLMLLAAGTAAADTGTTLLAEGCLLSELARAGDEVTVGALRERCAADEEAAADSLLLERLRRERAAEGIRSLLTAHERNYLLPATYSDSPNEEPFLDAMGEAAADEDLDRVEAKFQLSLKFNLAEGLLGRRDRLYAGFTTLSFWQAYNRKVSAPFRETNYEPELFWTAPLDPMPFGLDGGLVTLGLSHQSNGRGGTLSRSWNRVYAELALEKNNLVVSVKPWWRIPEEQKDDPADAIGDDNPDIDDYLGHFELTSVYRRDGHEWSLLLRNAFHTGRGAVQLDWTFPLWRGIRGHAQYFNGYGESLIDYDARIERFGIGILLTDML